jgi:hypothetical protein
MALITADELVRGLSIGVFGGVAGVCTLAFPGSPLWIVPAGLAVGGCALTVPEVRDELRRALPAARPLLAAPRALGRWVRTGEVPAALWQLPGVAAPAEGKARRAERVSAAPTPADPLFDALEGSPHRLIIGHSRGGKTTLIHHLATDWARRGERVLVGDPDAAPGMWPGCEVAGYGDDVASIGALLDITGAEVEARRQARATGVRQFAPFHLVIDEAHDVLPVLPGGLELFEDVARRGGKLNVRMTVGVQDKQVKTLGLEGKSALLRNFQTADVLKNREGRRVAVLRDAETGQKVSMVIPQLTDPESLIISRPSTATTTNLRPVADDQALLAAFLGEPVTSASGRPGNASGVTVTVPTADGNGNGNAAAVTTVTSASGRPGNASVVTVYAQATAGGRSPARKRRGLDMRARVRRAQERRAGVELQRAYAEARAAGVPSFRQAYAQLGGNREQALAAWQAAGG